MQYTPELQSSIDIVNDLLREANLEPLTHPGEIKDWGLTGRETIEQLRQLVNDYKFDLHAERCEREMNGDEWLYEQDMLGYLD